MAAWGVAALGIIAGCTPDVADTEPPVDTDVVVDTDPVEEGCPSPVTLVSEPDKLTPWGFVQLVGGGGTGSFRYSLSTDDPDASVHPQTGRLFAGGTVGVTYRATALDTGCGESATVEVPVVPVMTAAPLRATVEPRTSFELEIAGGVGEPLCELATDGSGATLSGCTYTAGVSGIDRVRISDPVVGTTLIATYTVQADAPLDLWGAAWMLPEGGYLEPRSEGGSGHLDIEVSSGDAVEVDQTGRIWAVEAGRSVLRVTDRFTRHTTDVVARVSATRSPDDTVDGMLGYTGTVVGGHDLDGDGYDDAVVGFAEANLGAQGSGAVFVYRGGPGGMDPDPVQTFGYDIGFEDEGGRALALADFDQDGNIDLVWTAEAVSEGGSSNGAAYLHRGVEGGFFEAEPARVFAGQRSFDRLGSGAAACDLDGDGWVDLALGAYAAEDRTADAIQFSQGAIFVWRGSELGFVDEPAAVRFGVVPDDEQGLWVGQRSLLMGRQLEGGDLDGDGRCDLVATYDNINIDGRGNDGVAWIWKGDEARMLEDVPVHLVTYDGRDNRANLGRNLAIGDMNRDGADDVLFGAWRMDSTTDAGAAVLFSGLTLTEPGPAVLGLEDALLTVVGDSGYDYFGYDVDLADLDGDNKLDMIFGAITDEPPGSGLTNSGRVHLVLGSRSERLLPGAEIVATEYGSTLIAGHDQAYMGQALAGVGDVDGDGDGDVLVLAGRDNAWGVQSGATYVVDADGNVDGPLELPVLASGHGYGAAMALFDVTGDGQSDLLVGGLGLGQPGIGANAGGVFSYSAARGDFSRWPAPVDIRYPTWSTNDRLGAGMAVSDIDGDGWDDLAVVAEADSKPTNYTTDVVNRLDCGGSRGSAGLVAIFKGGRDGISDEPTWVAHGPVAGGLVRQIEGGLDVNGDGYEDFVVGSWSWGGSSRGGVAVLHGGPALDGGQTALCFENPLIAPESGALLGWSISGLGDLDGDGCDEFAVGARDEDLGVSNQGVVRVLWGGGAACGKAPRVSTLTGGVGGARAGWSVAGGGDVDGDDIPDLVAAAPFISVDGASVGAVWLVPGSYLLTVPRQVLASDELPDSADTTAADLLPALQGGSLIGSDSSGQFGYALALAPDPDNPNRRMVVVGIPSGDVGSGLFAGGAVGYVYDRALGAFERTPRIVVGGELPGLGAMGSHLEVAQGRDGPVLMVGAVGSDVVSPDIGAAYAFPLEVP